MYSQMSVTMSPYAVYHSMNLGASPSTHDSMNAKSRVSESAASTTAITVTMTPTVVELVRVEEAPVEDRQDPDEQIQQ